MTISIEQKVRDDDHAKLYAQPAFRRFLLDVADQSGIARTTREEQQSLHLEGKRSLGLEILSMFADDRGPFGVIADGLEAQNSFTSKGPNND